MNHTGRFDSNQVVTLLRWHLKGLKPAPERVQGEAREGTDYRSLEKKNKKKEMMMIWRASYKISVPYL